MAVIGRLPMHEAATAAAHALEALLGHDVILAAGEPVPGPPQAGLLPAGACRSVVLPFGNGVVGELTLVATPELATSMEAATDDASLVGASLPALAAAAAAAEPVIHLQAEPQHAAEIDTDTLLTAVVGEFAVVPILEDDTVVACLVVRVVETAPPAATATPEGDEGAEAATPGRVVAPAEAGTAAPARPPAIAPAAPPGAAQYEFQPLADGPAGTGPARPLTLLNDVSVEVVAELGHTRLKVRDLVALEPGSVVQLDRTAGSPVDVLVNGSLLAHGEVVVIDEEFGVRVAEIVVEEG
jgi:flagellar motor switch protein FliN/FliY